MKKILLILGLVIIANVMVSPATLAVDDFWNQPVETNNSTAKTNNNVVQAKTWHDEFPVNWNAAKEIEYLKNKKRPWAASSLAQFFPSLGHLYAGDWSRGAKFLGLEAGEFLMMVSAAEDENAGLLFLGTIALMGTKFWEGLDAYKTAELYNAKLKRKINLKIKKNEVNISTNYKF
ncbi:hypothetical protein JCM16358_02480 [Halanaerocella petrolearia]